MGVISLKGLSGLRESLKGWVMSDRQSPKFRSLYGPMPDGARIWWSFLTILPFLLIMVISTLLSGILFIGHGFVTGAITDVADIEHYAANITANGLTPLLLFGTIFSILVTLFWVKVVENRSLASIGFTARAWLFRYLRGFFVGAVFLVVVIGIIYATGGYTIEAVLPVLDSATPMVPMGMIGIFLTGFIIQSAGEEIVFRGWWMSALAARRGTTAALIVTSIFFALSHMGNVYPPTLESMIGVANILLFGLFIGLYAVREGGIWGVCGWHAAWNWMLGTGFGLEVSGAKIDVTPLLIDLKDAGGNSLITGGAFGPEASLVATAVLFVGCLWFLRRPSHQVSEETAAG